MNCRCLINAHVHVLYLIDTMHFTLDSIPIKMTYSSPTIILYFGSILLHFDQNIGQKSNIVESEAR